VSGGSDWQAVNREEMRFFGDVSAAISHEINNRMAVIYEKAGLLEDLAARLAHGKEVDPNRFAVQSGKILEQVRLAREVIRSLNRFAHSVDVDHASVELDELLEFVAALYARKAAMAGATVSVSKAGTPVVLTTSPFVLQALVGRGLDFALAHVEEGGTVIVGAESAGDLVAVTFGGLCGVNEPIEPPDPAQGVAALLESLAARFRSVGNGSEMVLEIRYSGRQLHGRTE
jgi:C4-dicarboxylate-specific signal transduction histidine kinase